MTRRLLFLTVMIVAMPMLLFAAGQGESGTPAGQPAETEADETLAFSLATIQRAPPEEDSPAYVEFQERLNIDIDYVNIERNKYNEVLGLRIAAGEIPDVFLLDGNLLQYQQFAEQGVLAPLPKGLLRENAPTIAQDQEEHWPYLTIAGNVYAIQGTKVSNKYPLNAIWRDDWLANVGINKIPETLEEAEEALYALSKQDPDGNGKDDTYGLSKSGLDMIFGAVAGGHPWGPWPQYWQWVERDGELVFSAVLPKMKDALALLQKWYADGVLDPEYVLGENKGGYWAISHDFVGGRIGFTGLAHDYHWRRPQYDGDKGGAVYQEFVAANPDATFAFGDAVVGPDGYAGTWKYSTAVGAAGMWVMSSDLEESKMAGILGAFEKVFTDYDLWLLGKYGLEGEHWQRNEESGAVERLGDTTNGTERAKLGLQLFFMNKPEFAVASEPLRFEFSEEHATFPGIESELKTALPSEGRYRADLEKMRDQYFTEIITGRRPVDDFDEFVSEFYRLGGEQLTKEANEWYAQVRESM